MKSPWGFHHLLVILCIANAMIVCIHLVKRGSLKATIPRTYSYIGKDYPLELPLDDSSSKVPFSQDKVALTLHESIHFHLNVSRRDPWLDDKWRTLVNNPPGLGRVRLGPHNRVFNTVFYHQLHCLHVLQRAIIDPKHPYSPPVHVSHCLNYLRQTFLCQATDSLEPGDFEARDWDVEREGGTLVCRNWERVYEWMGTSFEETQKEQERRNERLGQDQEGGDIDKAEVKC
ncbi:hypothetical protein AX16_001192 [Volvariella volvacea WC 439]|nr:hypothetical protein AX16_001192 [Volvariella volvacea WC 439]